MRDVFIVKFLLDAYVGLGQEKYRLQQDDSWRKVDGAYARHIPAIRQETVAEKDKAFDSLLAAVPYLSRDGKIGLGQKNYILHDEKGVSNIGDILSEVSLHSKVWRTEAPRRFSRGELLEVLAAGDDSKNNSLIVDVTGYFQLISPLEARKSTSSAAIRHETFCAGNGYVGFQAARDEHFIRQTYLSSLEGWITHLLTGELQLYLDEWKGDKTEGQLIEQIKMITKHF